MEHHREDDTSLALSEVELGIVVNISTLREVLKGLSVEGKRWWIACDPRDAWESGHVSIGHGDPRCKDRLNTLHFRVPIVGALLSGASTDRLVVAIDTSTCIAENSGSYLENDRIVEDSIEDFLCFYEPLRRALIAKMQAGN